MISRLVILALLCVQTKAFYLPGAAPRDYAAGEKVPLLVKNLVKWEAVFGTGPWESYDYYDPRFDFCRPSEGVYAQTDDLASILLDGQLFNSPFDLRMLQNETCKMLCARTLSTENAEFLNARIAEESVMQWLIDGLPATLKAWSDGSDGPGHIALLPLVTLGLSAEPDMNNHYTFEIAYHKVGNTFRVVGVDVWSSSSSNGGQANCNTTEHLARNALAGTPFAYTYSVNWQLSETKWASRWDSYMTILEGGNLRWSGVLMTVSFICFLACLAGSCFGWSLRRDMKGYAVLHDQGVQELYGWRILHQHVFRKPDHSLLLSAFVGSGCQYLTFGALSLGGAALGSLSPSQRGSVLSALIILHQILGFVSGYVTSRIYTQLGGEGQIKVAMTTALFIPGTIYGYLASINMFLHVSNKSGVVPWPLLLKLLLMWTLISCPLSLYGAHLGYTKGARLPPASGRPQSTGRAVAYRPLYKNQFSTSLLGGFCIFASAFAAIAQLLDSHFKLQFYYAYGLFSLTCVLSSVVAVILSVLIIYDSLSHEDHRWQWHAVFIGGSTGIWIILYGLYYWAIHLSLPPGAAKVLYLSYLFLFAGCASLAMGSITFLASYILVCRLYAQLRME